MKKLTTLKDFWSGACSDPGAICVAEWIRGEDKVVSHSKRKVALLALATREAIRAEANGMRKVVAVAVKDGVELVAAQLAVIGARCCYLPVDINDPRTNAVMLEADVGLTIVKTRSDSVGLPGSVLCMDEFEVEDEESTIERLHLVEKEDGPDMFSLSHIFFTSGSTGTPKGVCVTHQSLWTFVSEKISRARLGAQSRVFLASAITFDPNLGDSLAALCSGACLCIASRDTITGGALYEALRQLRVTHACMTPTMWSMKGSLRGVDKSEYEDECKVPVLLPNLQELSLGGEPTPQDLAAASVSWALSGSSAALVSTYGVTEATVYQSTHWINNPSYPLHPKLIGEPYDGTQIGLLSATREEQKELSYVEFIGQKTYWISSTESPVPLSSTTNVDQRERKKAKQECECLGNVEGEIIIHGPQVAEGYLNREPLTKERFIFGSEQSERIFRTGDIGRLVWLTRGLSSYPPKTSCHERICGCGAKIGPFIEWVGREDTQIKYRGTRIEVEEIEAQLLKCKQIVARAVVCVHSTSDQLVAVVECAHPDVLVSTRSGDSLFSSMNRCAEIALHTFCTKQLPRLMVPSRYVIVESFAQFTSPNGKLNRRQLADVLIVPTLLPLAPNGHGNTSEDANSESNELSSLEKLVSSIWLLRLNLGEAPITPWDSFVQLGGDSLDAQRCSQDLAQIAAEKHQSSAIAQELLASSMTRGELVGGLEPTFLLQAKSLRAYANHLVEKGIDLLVLSSEIQAGETIEAATSNNKSDQTDAPGKKTTTDDHTLEKRALFIAAGDGLWPVVDTFVDPNLVGFSPDAYVDRNQRAKTPLHIACASGFVDVVRVLLDRGANVFATTREKIPASHIAAAFPGDESAAMLKLLIEAIRLKNVKSPASVRDGRKQTLVHAAARGGNPKVTELVLEELAKDFGSESDGRIKMVNCMDRWHRTALHWAVLNNHVECAGILLAHGANPKPHFAKKKTSTHLPYEKPLEIATRKGLLEMIELLERALSLPKG